MAEVIVEVGRRWDLDVHGWTVLVDGANATVRLPASAAAVHVGRPGVGAARAAALRAARHSLTAADIPTADLLPTRTGARSALVQGRVVEVEHWIEHDGRMNTWPRLTEGAALLALLARVHDAWRDLRFPPIAERCTWANWIAAGRVLESCDRAADRLRGWGLARLADDVIGLAARAAGPDLPDQVVHGDFWDDNVYVRDDRIVAVTDFDFLGRRPRIDDLALMLHFADEQPIFDGVPDRSVDQRVADLCPLLVAYDDALERRLSRDEIAALPATLARQALWTFGHWVVADADVDRARTAALGAADPLIRARDLLEYGGRWIEQALGR